MVKRTPVLNRFKGKVSIVTGGSSGIGRSIVEELCAEGSSVAFTGISDIGLNTENELKKQESKPRNSELLRFHIPASSANLQRLLHNHQRNIQQLGKNAQT